jgi:beta-glucosidase
MNAYPGENLQETYKEGLLVGYRWYDTKNIEPMYCFGYGLSYTSFSYSGLHTDKKTYAAADNIVATVKVANTGKYAGKETVQLYVSKPTSAVDRPEKELKAFKKVSIPAGQTANVALTIPVANLAYYDVKTSSWVVEPGEYKLLVGTSSKEILQSVVVMVK